MYDAERIEIENGIEQLLHYERGLVLFQKSPSFDVLVESSLAHVLRNYEDVRLGLNLLLVLDYAGVVAQFQHAALPLDHFILYFGELELLDDLDSHVQLGLLFDSTVDY